MKMILTHEMNRCILIVRDNGCIVRYPGGFWQKPGAVRTGNFDDPVDAIGTITITALVQRDLLSVAQYKNGPRGRFPITAILTKRGQAYVPPSGGIGSEQLNLFDN